MAWKDLPTWLKGGIIVGSISAVYNLIRLIGIFINPDYMVWKLYLIPLMIIVFLVKIIFSFGFGALIGLILSKRKSKKEQSHTTI